LERRRIWLPLFIVHYLSLHNYTITL
jgi:hypothetical protein